ncbi:ATP-dependent helicase [Candidatus Saccharibacteria bacterium]|nr:ATP-dependent helicase [Candidatus Saccharibacteria bacterium]
MARRIETLLEGLNAAQEQAILADQGRYLVVAGAGTGKTTVVTRRIAYLITNRGVAPDKILALTFTDQAAEEMEIRVDKLVPLGLVGTNIMTFHSLGQMILSEEYLRMGYAREPRLISGFQQKIFLRAIWDKLSLKYYAPLNRPEQYLESLVQYFSRLADYLVSPEQYQDWAKQLPVDTELEQEFAGRQQELAEAYQVYQQNKTEQGLVDFSDLISLPIQIIEQDVEIRDKWQKRFEYMMVDEYQDTNYAQDRLVELITGERGNLMVVGDDDQAIYQFRGADLSNILNYAKSIDQDKLIVLTDNYRSNQSILNYSHRLISYNNPDRLESILGLDKRLIANHQIGAEPELLLASNTVEEVDLVASKIKQVLEGSEVEAGQIAILIRNHSQARSLEVALDKQGLEYYTHHPEELLTKPEVKFLLDFLTILNQPDNNQAWANFLSADIWGNIWLSLVKLLGQSVRQHQGIEQILKDYLVLEDRDQEVADILNNILDLVNQHRLMARSQGVGKVLYSFLDQSGYLQGLINLADIDQDSARKIQNISKIFDLIREFSEIEDTARVYDFWYFLEQASLSGGSYQAEELVDSSKIQIMTIHNAKGTEFDYVFVYDLSQNTFPSTNRQNQIELPSGLIKGYHLKSRERHIAEERRLAYVATTRARQRIWLSFSKDHGGKRARKPSQFLSEFFDQMIESKSEAGWQSHLAKIINPSQTSPKTDQDLASRLYNPDGYLVLTPHMIEEYLRCPQEFWYWNVIGLPRNPHHSLVYGTAIHAAIEVYNRAKISGQVISRDQLIQVVRDNWKLDGFFNYSHIKGRLKQAEKTIIRYYDLSEAKGIFPDIVEKPLRIVLTDQKVIINLRIDAIYHQQGLVEIRDYKTSNLDDQKKADKRLKENIQLPIYALAWMMEMQEQVDRLSLEFVEHNILTSTNNIDHDKTLELISQVADGIAKRDFRASGRSSVKFDQFFA